MAKKSSTNKQRQASQAGNSATSKTQAAARQSSTATLVRAPKPGATELDTTKSTSGAAPQPSPAAASIVRDTPAAPAKSVVKTTAPVKTTTPSAPTAKAVAPSPKTPEPAAKPAPATGKRQDTRIARARATQRARQAGLISAENYSYVLGDLKLVAWLAGGAFVILIALTFILPR